MNGNTTWCKLVTLRAEVQSLCRRYADGNAIDVANEIGRLDRLSRPVGHRPEIERLIGEGKSDREIVAATGAKKQQVNFVRNSIKKDAISNE